MRLASMISIVVLCSITSAVSAGGNTLLVPTEYSSIQLGINAAIDGDTVLVESGIYLGNIDFLGKQITVISESGSDTTTIDATLTGESVVTFMNGETNLSILDGFKLRDGSATHGGGIHITNASPVIRNCVVTGNFASNVGGGIFVDSGELTLVDVTIMNNTSKGAGGGIYLKFSHGSITGGSIEDNNSTNGAGIYAKDGLLGSFVLSNVAIIGNVATSNGGGVYAKTTTMSVQNCTFDINSANRGGGWFSYLGGDATISNTVFTNNSALDFGGAAEIRSSEVLFVFCTFDSNVADSDCNAAGSGGAIDIVSSTVTLQDPVMCTNMACDVENDFSGDAPIINGEIFPCGADGACCGGSSCWEMSESDCLDGGGIWNGEGTLCADVSCVGGVDTGACCVSDQCIMASEAACIDSGGVFNGVDVLCSSVDCSSPACPADITGDGIVSVSDILEVISAWGACP